MSFPKAAYYILIRRSTHDRSSIGFYCTPFSRKSHRRRHYYRNWHAALRESPTHRQDHHEEKQHHLHLSISEQIIIQGKVHQTQQLHHGLERRTLQLLYGTPIEFHTVRRSLLLCESDCRRNPPLLTPAGASCRRQIRW
jgi:hypothetical protein